MTKERIEEIAKAFQEQPKPAPMDRKRVEEIALEAFNISASAHPNRIGRLTDYLAPFLGVEEPWIKCSERMPDEDTTIYAFGSSIREDAFAACRFLGMFRALGESGKAVEYPYRAITHWKPRHFPAPPVEEESELVRDIRKLANDTVASTHIDFNAVIKLLKCYEAKAGKS